MEWKEEEPRIGRMSTDLITEGGHSCPPIIWVNSHKKAQRTQKVMRSWSDGMME